MYSDELPKTKSVVTEENIEAKFEATRYPGMPLLDTECTVKIDRLCITWADQEKLVKELQGVLDRYKI